MKNGTFVSTWEEGVISTFAALNEKTGELFTKSVKAEGMECLVKEHFEDEDGNEYEVCPDCHEYILKTVMKEGVGKHLFEAQVCSNPDCENQ
jgi:hypothetical protein